MVINVKHAAWAILFAAGASHAGSIDGKSYTNFGPDLVRPMFPVGAQLAIYKNKNDAAPKVTLRDTPVVEVEGDWRACVKASTDGWVRCTVDGNSGWVKRSDFRTGGEYAAIEKWPVRWWLYVASDGLGGEEGDLMREAARTHPYLVAPSAYENIFFHVLFDTEGRAISPRNGKPTGDRVFVVGNAAYLAPANPTKRNGATWLFLNFFNEKLQALCPAVDPNSCMSAVNLAPGWPGIKSLYQEAPTAYRHTDQSRWFGAGEVAFARHTDPVAPLMYRVPDNVPMKIDTNPIKDAQIKKNRDKLFCIADCSRTVKAE